MAVRLLLGKFSIYEYRNLLRTGVLPEDDPIELIEGEVIVRSPTRNGYAHCVGLLHRQLATQLHGSALIGIQDPLELDDYSELFPDVIVLRWAADYYANRRATPPDVLLAIEVVDARVRRDREREVALYGAHGVPESWLIDLSTQAVTVYRQPHESGYGEVTEWRSGDRLALADYPAVTLAVDDILQPAPTPSIADRDVLSQV
jgi:Uma2 family endonuclease